MPQPHRGVSWAGLAAGPTAWAVGTQANYAIAPWLCGSHLIAAAVAAAFIAVALTGAALSWHAWQSPQPTDELVGQANGIPHNFLAATGALIAVLFAAVLLMQAIAAMMLSGCEH